MTMDKMDLSSDFGECENGDYTVSFNAISVRGERHKRNAEHNQDCFLIGIKNQIKYAIIADGLGSCGNSHIGSKKGTELFEKMVNEHLKYDNVLSEDDVRRFNQRFIENWKNLFQEGGENYDTTLLYVVVRIPKSLIIIGDILFKKVFGLGGQPKDPEQTKEQGP